MAKTLETSEKQPSSNISVSYRKTMGVFNTSILENLRYAKFEATLAERGEACRAIGLYEKIRGSFRQELRKIHRGEGQ